MVKLCKECISWVRVSLRFNLRIVIHRRFGLGGRQNQWMNRDCQTYNLYCVRILLLIY